MRLAASVLAGLSLTVIMVWFANAEASDSPTTQDQESSTTPKVRNVAIVVWDNAELLDFTGPGEVFAATMDGGGHPFNTYLVSKDGEPIVSQGFVKILPNYSIDECPPPDVIVLPGGGVTQVREDAEFMQSLDDWIEEAEVVLSVCTGAFILAQLGHLDGLEATTWHGAIRGLRKLARHTVVHDDRRFVDNGKIVTGAGVSAGIDAALHVVAKLIDRKAAERTAEYMEYRWQSDPKGSDRGSSSGR